MNRTVKAFCLYLIRLTAKAYTAFILTIAIVAGILTGLQVAGLVRPRTQPANHERIQIEEVTE